MKKSKLTPLLVSLFIILNFGSMAVLADEETTYYYPAKYQGQLFGADDYAACEERSTIVANNLAMSGKKIVNFGCALSTGQGHRVVVSYRTLDLFENIEKYQKSYKEEAECRLDRKKITHRFESANYIAVDSYCYASYAGVPVLVVDYLSKNKDQRISLFRGQDMYELSSVCEGALLLLETNLENSGSVIIDSDCSAEGLLFIPKVTYSHLSPSLIYKLIGKSFTHLALCESGVESLRLNLASYKLLEIEIFCKVKKSEGDESYEINASFIKKSKENISIEEDFLRSKESACELAMQNINRQLGGEGRKVFYSFCRKEGEGFRGLAYYLW